MFSSSEMGSVDTVPNSPVLSKQMKEDVFKLDGFDNEDITKMASIIDKFRESGLEEDISLPQLVVTGNQSAGKSSLLESLTGLPFPVGMGVCTRFATQVNLRRSYEKKVTASLSNCPHKSKIQSAERLIFPKNYADEINAEEFSTLLEEASTELGIEASESVQGAGNGQKFAKSILKIEVSGPERHFLSFVDTPGLFHSGTNDQSVEDAAQVQSLVKNLVSDRRTIIVVVMDSRNEPSTQTIFNLVKSVDPTYARTVGVLTKCDTLSSQGEINYAFRIANNECLDLKRGWFVVKNKSSDDQENGISLNDTLESEREFFSRPKWRDINPQRQGVVALRNFLTTLFAQHVKSEFPKLLREMRTKLKKAQTQLLALGSARTTSEQQKKYLLQASRKYQEIIHECNSGGYLDSRDSRIHLWQHIKEHEQLFQTRITSDEGRLREFIPLGLMEQSLHRRAGRSSTNVNNMNCSSGKIEDIYTWISKEYQQSAGPECSFLVQPRLVDALFKQQTSPWEEISVNFIHNLVDILKGFVKFATDQCCTNSHVAACLKERVDKLILEACKRAQNEILTTLASEQRRIRIHDDAKFSADIYKARLYRMIAAVNPLYQEANKGGISVYEVLNIEGAQSFISELRGPQSAVLDIHDLLAIYYPIALERFKGNVVQIGDGLVMGADSPALYFSVDWVNSLSAEELQHYAGEDAETAAERLHLTEKVQRLQDALALAEPALLSLRVGPVIHQEVSERPSNSTTLTADAASDSSNQTTVRTVNSIVPVAGGRFDSSSRSSFSTPSPFQATSENALKVNPFNVLVTPPHTPEGRGERAEITRRPRMARRERAVDVRAEEDSSEY